MSAALTPRAAAKWVAQDSALFASYDSPFVAQVSSGGSPRLVLVTGENASGKSLFVRVMAARAHAMRGWRTRSVSIRERAGGGFATVFYGEEGVSSTGTSSFSVVRRTLEASGARDGEKFMIVLDEPELGMSEGYARALGEYIAQQAPKVPPSCAGVVLVTHSRPLVRGLLDNAARAWTHVSLGAPAGIARWLDSPEARTVQDLHDLESGAHERFLWISGRQRS